MLDYIHQQGIVEILLIQIIKNQPYLLTFINFISLNMYCLFNSSIFKFNDQPVSKQWHVNFLQLVIMMICGYFNGLSLYMENVVLIQLTIIIINCYPKAFTLCEGTVLAEVLIEMVRIGTIGCQQLYDGNQNAFVWINIILGWIVINIGIMYILKSDILLLLSLIKNALLIVHVGQMANAQEFLFRKHTFLFILIMGVVTIIGLGIIIGLRKSKIWDNIIGRKLFHFLIFFIVAFGFYLNVMLIYVSLVLVLHLFIIIEILRQLNFNQCKHYFNYFLMQFTDSRDSDDLIITHIYLALGVSVGFIFNVDRLFKYEGLLSVLCPATIIGVGDSFAAIIGSKFGRLRIGKKSVEGLIAGIVSCMMVLYFFIQFYHLDVNLKHLGMKVSVLMLLEMYTKQVDNLILCYISVLLI